MHVATQPSSEWKPAGPRRVSEAGGTVKAAAGTGEDPGAGGGGENPTTFHLSRSSCGCRVFPPKLQLRCNQVHGAQRFPLLWKVKETSHLLFLFFFFLLLLEAFSFGAPPSRVCPALGAG